MLVFGVDIPLVEILLLFSFVTFLILIEVIVILVLVLKEHNRAKK